MKRKSFGGTQIKHRSEMSKAHKSVVTTEKMFYEALKKNNCDMALTLFGANERAVAAFATERKYAGKLFEAAEPAHSTHLRKDFNSVCEVRRKK